MHIREHIKPFIFVAGIYALSLTLWITRLNQAYLNSEIMITSILGMLSLMTFMLTFLLATKLTFLVRYFGGLEILYMWHRMLAMFSLVMIYLHETFSTDDGLRILSRYLQFGVDIEELGELSRNLFIALIVCALLAKFFKYEHFKWIHRLILIPYLLGLYHGFASSWIDLLSFDYLSIFMIVTSLIGITSSLYMIFFYEIVAFKYTGSVVSVTHLTKHMIDIHIKVSKPYKFKAGQHCFIKFEHEQLSKHPHPFSISGSDHEHVYFTIKNLGDFTQSLVTSLTPHTIVHLSKPYGHMVFSSRGKKQVWIAGGVGITPFLSYVRSPNLPEVPITLIYAVRTIEEAVHIELFKSYALEHSNFTFILHESSKEGYLKAASLPIDLHTYVSMCGPRMMIRPLKKAIIKRYKGIEITSEAFSFTGNLVHDILHVFKSLILSLKRKKHTP